MISYIRSLVQQHSLEDLPQPIIIHFIGKKEEEAPKIENPQKNLKYLTILFFAENSILNTNWNNWELILWVKLFKLVIVLTPVVL